MTADYVGKRKLIASQAFQAKQDVDHNEGHCKQKEINEYINI